MATVRVDSEKALRDAIAKSKSGDVILVAKGDYHLTITPNSIYDIQIRHSLTIVGEGTGGRGMANFYADAIKPDGKRRCVSKGIFSLVLKQEDTVTFENIGFYHAHASSWNGAGIRQNGGNLTVKNCYFDTCDMGILSITKEASKRADVRVSRSEFARCGYAGAHPHAMYVRANNFIVEKCNVHDTIVGHHVKSVSFNTVVKDCILDDGAGTSSYAVDVSAGGDALIIGNTMTQGPLGQNTKVVNYSIERFNGVVGNVVIRDNTVINRNLKPKASKFLANRTSRPVTVTGNTFTGFLRDLLFMGPVIEQNNKVT